ncbi:YlbF/YmcA family competence regulator [Streptococcus sp. zg-JUN1979]|uniref:YlbF/YmcA family competence regulator n=1 Tax=Streptococcus sp. zg-JUN1979 TaxID=3391450 RepID=UPI0039A6B9CD
MANIYDIANQLEREIRQLPDYKAVLEAKAAIETDEAAKTLWQEFTQAQARLQGMMQTGQMPSQEEQESLGALVKRLEENPQLKTYLDAQQRLSVYISDIEKIIFEPLQDLN